MKTYAVIKDGRVKNVFQWDESIEPVMGNDVILKDVTSFNPAVRTGDVYNAGNDTISVPDASTISSDALNYKKRNKIASLIDKYNTKISNINSLLDSKTSDIRALSTENDVDNFDVDIF